MSESENTPAGGGEARASFRNMAGREDIDDVLAAELEAAGITVHRHRFLKNGKSEVNTEVMGDLHGWGFHRAWRYWVADGPGIEVEAAERLHATHGNEVRVSGHCGCPSPREQFNGLAVGSYHIDSPSGLKALADTIRVLVERPAAQTEKGGTEVPADPLVAYLERQWSWSKETFGPALRTKGIVQHITKELREIEADPHDLAEWVDVIILAMDGFWRHGGRPSDLLPAMQAKQDRNFARTWPDWRTMGEDQAIEHDRSGEAPTPVTSAPGAERCGYTECAALGRTVCEDCRPLNVTSAPGTEGGEDLAGLDLEPGTPGRLIQRLEDAASGGLYICDADREEAVQIATEEMARAWGRLMMCPEEGSNEHLCAFPSCTCAHKRLPYPSPPAPTPAPVAQGEPDKLLKAITDAAYETLLLWSDGEGSISAAQKADELAFEQAKAIVEEAIDRICDGASNASDLGAQGEPVAEPVEFDAGHLPNAGRDADAWQDAIRQLLTSAHDHYVEQFRELAPAAQGEPVATVIYNGDHAEFERKWAGRDSRERPDWPLPSFDAVDWAEAFCKLFSVTMGGKQVTEPEGLMIGWFANALMRGFDEHARRAAPAAPRSADLPEQGALDWAVGRWKAEVKNRPLRNVHRRALDTTWRQVIHHFGGDPDALVGPSHDDLVAEATPPPTQEMRAAEAPAASRPVEQGDPAAMADDLTKGCVVSVDVSTDDHDAHHRIFGVIREVQRGDSDGGLTFLADYQSHNFEGAPVPHPAPAASRPALGREEIADTIAAAVMSMRWALDASDKWGRAFRKECDEHRAEVREVVLALLDPRDDTRAGGADAQEGGR